ncbi:antibiotic biosynthesis monooxygenase [Mycobacterium ahvazicum]|uniref:Antibiotic biosynthesis monooxygenase n=1 Tax=Mycobacterium ahvazicum TaxID=1964395 RepID=A0A2K4YDJ0_9MYCO|nr:hypothetical protein [Mycobacterium ahvazicum]SOX54828.1 antibiotic biosynthesis monooxygenase [Mycobacterium ahvazicum]
MIIETATPMTLGVLTTFDVVSHAHASVLASLCATAEEFASDTANFAGGAWLTRVAAAGQSHTPGIERVVQYLQWDNGADGRALLADSATAGHPAAAHRDKGDLAIVSTQLYRVDAVVSGDGLGRAVIEVPHPGSQLVTGIITIDPVPGKQGWINEYNQSETRDHIQYLPGFVSAGFLMAEDSQLLTEFVQWVSTDHFTAAFQDDRFREHIDVANHYSTSDLAVYQVDRTLERIRVRR